MDERKWFLTKKKKKKKPQSRQYHAETITGANYSNDQVLLANISA